MSEFLIARMSFIIPMLLGAFAYWWIIRFANWSIGVTFSDDVLPTLEEDPQALAHYFGLRNLAIAVVVGLVTIAGVLL